MNDDMLGEEAISSLVWLSRETRGSGAVTIGRDNRGGEGGRYHGSALGLRALGAILCLVSVARASAEEGAGI